MSAGEAELLQRLGKSSFPQRTRAGLNCPMLRPEGASTLLLLLKILSPFPFLLRVAAALLPPLLFLPWKRSVKSQPSSVTIWTAC